MKKSLVWAHRGASGYEKENTMAAFRKAIEMGADGIELDVQLSKDGEMVVIHDETIDRTTSGTGYVKDYTYIELCEISNHEIPTLREVYQLFQPTSLEINVELKTSIFFYDGMEQMIIDLTEEFGMEDRIIYSSFNHLTIQKIRELRPQARTGLLYADGYLGMASYGEKMGVEALHPALFNLQYPNFLQECKEKGLKLHVWTVNEEEHMKMMVDMGIDAIITNYPDKAKRVVAEK
ncbi:MAG: glycerophosphodiester phosphodiesterase [Eubacteriales bacterium]